MSTTEKLTTLINKIAEVKGSLRGLERTNRGGLTASSKKKVYGIVNVLASLKIGVPSVDQYIDNAVLTADNVTNSESNDEGGYTSLALNFEATIEYINLAEGQLLLIVRLLKFGVDVCRLEAAIKTLEKKDKDDDDLNQQLENVQI